MLAVSAMIPSGLELITQSCQAYISTFDYKVTRYYGLVKGHSVGTNNF